MSDTIYVVGDVAGVKDLETWQATRVDKKIVGKLSKGLEQLRHPITVADTLACSTALACAAARITLAAATGSVTLRAVLARDELQDLAAPLVGAFRAAGENGARGDLWLVAGGVTPDLGYRLDVDGGAFVQALKKSDLKAFPTHPAHGELVELAQLRAANPPVDPASEPFHMRTVWVKDRGLYRSMWRFIEAADEAALLAAAKRLVDWVHPHAKPGTHAYRAAAASSKAELLAIISEQHAGSYRGNLDLMFEMAAWVDAERGTALLADARRAGIAFGASIRGLLAGENAGATSEAWQIFDACCDAPETDLNLWYFSASAPYAISESAIATSDLASKLDDALQKKSQAAAQKRIEGICLALAYRKDEAAHVAIDRAVANAPEKLKSCLVAYAAQNGWQPKTDVSDDGCGACGTLTA